MMPVVSSPFGRVPIDDRPLHEFVFDACRTYGEQTAFIDLWSNKSYTFSEIGTRCKSAAVGWHAVGLNKGDVVAILLPNCCEFMQCYVGAVCRGALCSGLNPTYGTYELSHYLSVGGGGSGARFVVTVADRLPVLDQTLAEMKAHRVECIYVVDAHEQRRCARSNVPVKPFEQLYGRPDSFDYLPPVRISTRTDAVYMPYSSGTTGLPKGVLVTHYLMAAAIAQLGIDVYSSPGRDDHVVMFLPIFHIYGFIFFFKQLTDGVTVVSVPRFDPIEYFGAVQKYKCPQLYLVPTVMVFMAKHDMMDQFDLSCVRAIFAGAAPIGQQLIRDIRRRFPTIEHVYQGYGMSETGVSNAQCLTGGEEGIHMKPGSVGPLCPNYEAKVVDPSSNKELGANAVGELYIRAPALMLGYLDKGDATAATIDADGWLHTGDLSYYDVDGDFYIVERLKELIKVSGFQVAPAELEDLLLSHPAVAEAAVVGVPQPDKGQVPRAYIVPKRADMSAEDKQQLRDDLQQFVQGKAAHFKRLLGGVILAGEIPKLPSGKILRRVLREQIAQEFTKGGGVKPKM